MQCDISARLCEATQSFSVFICAEQIVARRKLRAALFRSSCAKRIPMASDADEFLALFREHTAEARDQSVSIDVTLNSLSDYEVVRQSWIRLVAEVSSPLTMRITLFNAGRDCLSRSQLIVDLDDHEEIVLQNKLAVLGRLNRDSGAVLLTAVAPLFLPDYICILFLATDPQSVLFQAVRDVALRKDLRVVFLRNGRPELHRRVERAFWKLLFSTDIPEVLCCDQNSHCVPLRLFDEVSPTTLYVFPERMLPVRRAYYVRAFDLLLGLAYAGEPCSVLVLGPRNSDLERIKSALEIFSPNVTAHPLRRGRFPLWHQVVRIVEMFLRKRAGYIRKPPLRFVERCYLFATRHNAQLLLDTLKGLNTVRNVVFTGPWFTPAVLPAKAALPNLSLYCDTIDVFYVLDRDSNALEKRYLYSAKRQKNIELRMLNCVDGAIAISEADGRSLKAENCKAQILVESGSFSHVTKGADFSRDVFGLVFGFIGSNNANNEKCVALIRDEWWPAILTSYPHAELIIAGGVCESSDVKLLLKRFPASVKSVGFVDVLAEFYDSVHVMLSPIAVQGGLNFKSVESLMAGRPLLTNELGSRCLGDGLEGVSVVSKNAENINELIKSVAELRHSSARRWQIHRSANERFSDNVAYASLIRRLKSD